MRRLAARPGPWFRRHPTAAVVVGTILFVAIVVLRFTTGDERDASALLFALPVTLFAMAFGLAVGVVAAGASIGTLVLWVASSGATFGALGWVSRILPILLLGVLVGWASDQEAEVAATRVELALSELRRREAAELHDEVLQRIAVAKWSLEGGRVEPALDHLQQALEAGEQIVASLLAGTDEARVVQAPSSRSSATLS